MIQLCERHRANCDFKIVAETVSELFGDNPSLAEIETPSKGSSRRLNLDEETSVSRSLLCQLFRG